MLYLHFLANAINAALPTDFLELRRCAYLRNDVVAIPTIEWRYKEA